MRQLVLTCVMAMLGAGCVEVIPHIDEYDAGPSLDAKSSDAMGEAEVSLGQCTSGVRWTMGDTAGSPAMTPGKACLASGCHTSSSKNAFTMAGTLYPLKGERDEDNCNGFDQTGPAIGISDEGGAELFRVPISAAGNFYTTRSIPSTFRVKVIAQGRDAVMMAPVTNGDCNYCHRKEDFMGAKGRIVPAPP